MPAMNAPTPRLTGTLHDDRTVRSSRGLLGSVIRRWHREIFPAPPATIAGNSPKAPDSIALSLLDSLREPLAFVVRSGGRWCLTGGNAALGKLLDSPTDRLDGLSLDEVLVQVPGAVDPVAQALERGTPSRTRGQIIDQRGNLKRVAIRVEPVCTAGPMLSGKPSNQAMIYFDPLEAEIDSLREATHRLRDAEQRVRRQSAELERLQNELHAFGAMLAHDLRAPLRAIGSLARQLDDERETPLPAGAQARLTEIRRAGEQMDEMIGALRELTVVSGRPVQRIPIDLGDLAREVLTELRRAPASAGLAAFHQPLRLDIANGMVVQADRMLMRLLLTNLLGNAIKFSADRPSPAIAFGQSTHTGRRVFHIRDNGVGFDIAQARRLFDMFQRLPGHDHVPGHGIGLAICRRVVRRFNGEIWASGLPGEGACFYFTVPDPSGA